MDWLGVGRSQNAYEHFRMHLAEYQGKDFPRPMELSRQEPSELGDGPQQLVFCSLGYHTLPHFRAPPTLPTLQMLPGLYGSPMAKIHQVQSGISSDKSLGLFLP